MTSKLEWHEFEKLVARMEAALAPKGAVVKSPAKVLDLVSGSWREVDASIRYKIGTVPVLITVKCRKRRTVQDDTWIEQLATKKHKDRRCQNHCSMFFRFLKAGNRVSKTIWN